MRPEPDRGHPYRQELYRILEEREWLDRHIGEIMENYALRWIAIQDRSVIAVADKPDALREELKNQGVSNYRMMFFVPSSVHTPV